MLKYPVIIYLSFFVFEILVANRCCHIVNRNAPKFKLIRRHSRSTKFILSENVLATVKQCQDFAVMKKALAFNFYSLDISMNFKTKIDKDRHNCQVIGCPETNVVDSLISDKKFSYYSLYSPHILPVNDSVICVPRVGLFVTSKKFRNYTNAQADCMKMHGKLAHIVSEERSVGLAKYISDTPTFIGLSNRDKDNQWKNEFDEPLSCFEYRAWSNGEPSSRGCVTLITFIIGSPSMSLPAWQVVTCSELLPFICEILPNFTST